MLCVERAMSKRSTKVANPFYMSNEWKALRLQALRRDRYICQHCGAKCLGKAKGMPSPQVDHIKTIRERPDLKLSLGNVRTLCHSCHSRHTMADQLNKPEIGLDGWPIQSA